MMISINQRDNKRERLKEVKIPFEQSEADEILDSLESTQEEERKILEEMLEQQDQISISVQNIIQGNMDLKSYGISQADQQLFQFYSNKMKSEREQMRQFWKKLIGDAKKK